ncbi:N-acetylmuramoyl-L-alanine amidase [Burkholderia humptydooensis]|uniref:N-acetylmuramoyl-L-alanine amidase n=1 Tax=Burkholderia humptydooensis TaxID=430531 RepID=A0A7U4P9F4_9BURK|nr:MULTISPECIES: N-acetylmuramoyl-L-alanine amidase [Burkholderia]AJY38868.1 N-acetylmuramoyl-L-alanine amidase family protein [Burkholderia sp. 2002721687]ALX45412.1 N-acetylmuramoyl-L-alanine amidase [Burkholderia humptydooensis]QPS46885.1 N-acetylmuramoyl-L-alanine amidase [Burkholderia humptydooensis]
MSQPRQTRRDDIVNAKRRRFIARASLCTAGVLASPYAAHAAGGNSRSASDARRAHDLAIAPSISSPNQDSRVRTLVLHYTAQPLARSVALLTDPTRPVSAHYLVPDAADEGKRFRVFALVPESRRAWHAGVSYWQGERLLNAGSIGIEIVNAGFPDADEDAPLMQRRWSPFPDEQMAAVGRLAADIVARHAIPPQKVVGHSDIAPGRKLDPGPLFPWRTLYEQYGVGAWPDAIAVAYYRACRPFRGEVAELQAKLLAYGYDTPQTGALDLRTTDAIAAFQMHFRPARYDGVPDVETVAILDALLDKYIARDEQPLRDEKASTPEKNDQAPALGFADANPLA